MDKQMIYVIEQHVMVHAVKKKYIKQRKGKESGDISILDSGWGKPL